MENILEETRFIMKKYNIKANKSLGQNFLIDDNVVEGIVDAGNISNEDLVIEIGPGLGTLTKPLLERAGKVISIELDKRMVKILEDRFSLYNNFELIQKDVLKVDLKELIERNKKEGYLKNAKIVRRCIVAKVPIKKGELLTESNLTTKRPNDGIGAQNWFEVVGKHAIADFSKDEKIYF